LAAVRQVDSQQTGYITRSEVEVLLQKVVKLGPDDTNTVLRDLGIAFPEGRLRVENFVDWLLGIKQTADTSNPKDHSVEQLNSQVDSFFARREGSVLGKAFDKFSIEETKELEISKLSDALKSVGIFRDDRELVEVSTMMDVDKNGAINKDQFLDITRTPTSMDQWARTLPLGDLLSSCLPHKEGEPLQVVGSLTEEELLNVEQAFQRGFKRLFEESAAQLREAVEVTKRSAEAALNDKGVSKYSTFKMSCGNVDNFHEGLQGRIGAPSLEFLKAMRAEHCSKGGCDLEFTTTNYHVTTTPRKEWEILLGLRECPESDRGHGRTLQTIEELSTLSLAKKAGLQEIEIIAVCLYTGPMFQIYNAILRRFPQSLYEPFEASNNLYATTIHVLVSAVQKVAKVMPPPEGLTLYCGLGGLMELPQQFWTYNEFGCRGYTEWGFRSTTSDKAIAIQYSGAKEGKPLAMVLEIQVGAVDRGACIRDFSQYPAEVEYLWVPCSYIEPSGHIYLHVLPEGVVKVIPVRVNANLKAKTVEDLLGQKKTMHMTAFRQLLDETRHHLETLIEENDADARLQREMARPADKTCGFSHEKGDCKCPMDIVDFIVKQCREVYDKQAEIDASTFANDESYRKFIGEMLDTKKFAIAKMCLWLEDETVTTQELGMASWSTAMSNCSSLSDAFASYVSFLNGKMNAAEDGSEEQKQFALRMCKLRGLVASTIDEDNGQGQDPFLLAVKSGAEVESLKLLLKAGADINRMTPEKETPLTWCISCGEKQKIRDLIALGADINRPVNGMILPIIVAISKPDPEIVRLLVELGASPTKGVMRRCSPMDFAKQLPDDGQMVALLEELAETSGK